MVSLLQVEEHHLSIVLTMLLTMVRTMLVLMIHPFATPFVDHPKRAMIHSLQHRMLTMVLLIMTTSMTSMIWMVNTGRMLLFEMMLMMMRTRRMMTRAQMMTVKVWTYCHTDR